MMVSMLYAHVIVKQRTNVEELTYAIPASMVPYIRRGSLVTAPLRRRIVPAVVVGLGRSVAQQLRPKIRELISINREQSLTDEEIKVVEELADYYGASLAEVAFHALERAVVIKNKPVKTNAKEPIFIQAPAKARFLAYIRLLKKQSKRSFLCIFAQRHFAEAFLQLAREHELAVYPDDGTKRFRTSVQKLADAGERFIVVSTSGGIFFPLNSGDGLVIDQPTHIGLKQQQRPYMRAMTVGQFRAKHEQLRLILGDDLVSVELIPFVQSGRWQLMNGAPKQPETTIVSRLRSNTLLLPTTRDVLTPTSRNARMLVVVLARGWASAYICQTCGHLFSCPECDQTMAVDKAELVCRFDGTRVAQPLACPDCRGEDLRAVGEGVSRVASEIRRLLPSAPVAELSSDQPELPSSGVVVATEKVLSFPLERYELVVCASVDRWLGGIGLDDRWQLLKMLRFLSAQTSRLVIQTFFPEDPIWSFGQSGVRQFFAKELAERRRLTLPPYGLIFAVVGRGRNASELSKSGEQVIRLVSRELKNVTIGSPALVTEGKNRWRATITCTTARLTVPQKRTLADLLPPAWHLDIEPAD